MSTELTTPIKIEIPGIGTIESADLYLKSEADKVIAGLKEEIHNLKRSLIVARHDVAKAIGKKSSNKYRAKFKEAK